MIKLIFFDLEGTLFRKAVENSSGNTAPSAWTKLAKHLGAEVLAKEELSKQRWNNNEYAGYVEWMEDTIKIYRDHALTRNVFIKVIDSIDYNPNVRETFAEIKKMGLRTGIISGGFKAQADRAQIELRIDHSFAACELFWDTNENLLHWNLLPCDYEGKLDFMNLIMNEHGLSASECAFVGDGKNDIALAKAVGLSFAFNGAEELKKVTTYAIDEFSQLLDHIKQRL